MNKELKSLLILSLLAAQIGASNAVADGPGYSSGPRVQPQTQSAPPMGEYAGAERTQAAMGHYARARTLLVEAMREFDRGKEIARPDLIVNSETWKSGVSARADELNHIIAPEARETTGGTRFKESHALLNENFDKPKKVASSAPRPVRKVEKKQLLVSAERKESTTARARMEDSEPLTTETEVKKTVKVTRDLEPVEPSELDGHTAKKTTEDKEINDLLSSPKVEVDPETEKAVDAELSKTMGEKLAEDKPKSDSDHTSTTAPEESETAKSINDEEIRARLKKLSEEIAQEEKSRK